MSSPIDDLFTLTLVDGIKTTTGAGKELRYRVVRLRETSVADERAALRLAERVVNVGGVPKLLASDADFNYAMTMRHIENIECDGQVIQGALIDLDLFGKLSGHDLGLIESRVFLITMAAQVRYGELTQADFDALLRGENVPGKTAQAPQPVGQAAELGSADPVAVPGPALLADFAGGGSDRPLAGDGQ